METYGEFWIKYFAPLMQLAVPVYHNANYKQINDSKTCILNIFSQLDDTTQKNKPQFFQLPFLLDDLNDPRVFTNLPSKPRFRANEKESFTISTLLCSGKFTQNGKYTFFYFVCLFQRYSMSEHNLPYGPQRWYIIYLYIHFRERASVSLLMFSAKREILVPFL